ncbi:MAG: ABC transporter ATP-binding protein [Opitutales bacterium]|nr:ABC transporter ATP-binding protein [Opitutales bacterium]
MGEKKLPILRAEDISKEFPSGTGRLEVLRALNFSLEAGVFASIRGESGGGKTTLLNILGGLEAPTSGTVYWGDGALPKQGLARLALKRAGTIGMVFQNFYLVPELSAFENVLLAARVARRPLMEARERAESLLREVGLGERLHSPPAHLSGGERQRVAVARALVNRPAAVLADEPTGNLDEVSSGAVMELLQGTCEAQGASLLLVTHSRAFAALATHSWVLRAGRLETA